MNNFSTKLLLKGLQTTTTTKMHPQLDYAAHIAASWAEECWE